MTVPADVDYDPSELGDEAVDDGFGGGEGHTVEREAAVGVGIEGSASVTVELAHHLFIGLGVPDDVVYETGRLGPGWGGGGVLKDPPGRVGSTLSCGPGKLIDGGVIAVFGSSFFPVGFPLGLHVLLEDLIHGRPGQRPDTAPDLPTQPEMVLLQPEITSVMAAFGGWFGPVLVDQPLPVSYGQVELGIRQPLRVAHEPLVPLIHVSGDPPIGMDLGQQADLVGADLTREVGLAHRGQSAQHLTGLLPTGRLTRRQPAQVTDHHLGRYMTIVVMQTSSFDLVHDRQRQCSDPPSQHLQLGNQTDDLTIVASRQLEVDPINPTADSAQKGFGPTNTRIDNSHRHGINHTKRV